MTNPKLRHIIPSAPAGLTYRARRVQVGQISGFAASSAGEGKPVEVVQRGRFLASTPYFYLFINQIEADFLAPLGISGDRITKFVAVLHPDGEADVYIDFELIVQAEFTRPVLAGAKVTTSDISRIESGSFGGLKINADDSVVCVVKMGWKYGLFFDFTRKISTASMERELGILCNELHADRLIENIQRQIAEAAKTHIITEGKTDWRHIEAARRVLDPHLVLGYPSSDDTLGDEGLIQLCERLGKFGPTNQNKVIAIFDRDNPKVLKKLQEKGDLETYQAWGNNVYSIVLPTPEHRQEYQNISIEMLYLDEDLARTDEGGKRLYFDNEIETIQAPGGAKRCVAIPAEKYLEYTKKLTDGLSSRIIDSSGRPVALSKARFAELVYEKRCTFSEVDFRGFSGLIDRVKIVLALPGEQASVGTLRG